MDEFDCYNEVGWGPSELPKQLDLAKGQHGQLGMFSHSPHISIRIRFFSSPFRPSKLSKGLSRRECWAVDTLDTLDAQPFLAPDRRE